MPAVNTIIILLMALFCLSFARTIKFAPLPLKPKDELIDDYIPLVEYLAEKTGLNIQLVYIDSYEKVVEEFKKGNVQMTILGALSYVKLSQEYRDAKAIFHIKEKDGSSFYRCVLVALPDGPKRVRDVRGPVALPQKLSTCGEFSANIILFSHSKDLAKLGYKNFKDYNQAVEAVLKGEFEVAVVREETAKQYEGYGIRVLAHSPSWPSYTIVVNTRHVPAENIESIKMALLSASWKDLRGFVVGKYGFSEVKKEDYEKILNYKKFIP